MIIATVEELYQQVPGLPRLRQALDYIQNARGLDLPDGRYEIDGSMLYALVQSYQTLPPDDQAKYEAHRNYIDVQYIVSGVEVMGWAPLERMQVTKEYQPEKDIVLGTCQAARSTLTRVEAGEAAVFFPQDAHAPKLTCAEPGQVKKIVVKAAIG